MKNITVSVDEEIYRLARIKAAERDSSVSALVRQFLIDLGHGESQFERLAQQEKALRARIDRFKASDRLDRARLHER